MSVIGFDIGNENCVIGVAKQRGIDVVLNDESNRETPGIVSFGDKQRFIGVAGAASATMNPKSTISQVKRLIGRMFRESSVQDDLRLLPFQTSEAPDGGILINLRYLDEWQAFKPVQILAMLIGHLKYVAEKSLGVMVSDCVIGVPSYFTELQRREYFSAAEIAGLKPLRLMHDCTATALGYGIYKNDFQSGGATNVVFVDVGHCDTQVAVVSFEPGHMKILSHAFDSNLGGRDFDEVLVRYFAGQFKEQYKIDVYSSPRAIVRLRAACEKLKKVLSANAEAPLNIECLMDEKDVKGFIKRDDFEKLSSQLLERITIPCRQAVLNSGLTVEKIHTIELVGSGSRVPAMTKVLSSLFSKEPSRTINASECVARGCALQCAMLSPIFRVRDYEVEDSFPYSIGFAFQEGPVCSLPNGMLFPKGHPFPSIKMLTLNRATTFHMEAYYSNEDELPPCSPTKISRFTIGPFPASHAKKVKVKVRVQLNLHGIITVESASVIEDHADDSQVKVNAGVYSEDMELPNHDTPSSENNVHPEHSSSVFRKPNRRLDIHITENVNGALTAEEFFLAKEKELQLVQQDVNMEQTKELKNSLESYVYDTRNKVFC
ncbi:Hsp70 family chaperone [Lithospermum erythrorhizon]|uniref:Hsp70 family chaperone n=1 Tax=Lithospermum erythrorhizon TaxID=34254 RepID=A0AAV3RIY2_LITER